MGASPSVNSSSPNVSSGKSAGAETGAPLDLILRFGGGDFSPELLPLSSGGGTSLSSEESEPSRLDEEAGSSLFRFLSSFGAGLGGGDDLKKGV